MQAIDPIDAREAEIVRIAESREETAALHQHLTEIIEGTVFKGSHRSCQFLKYIVDQAIAGHFDSLKERVIGVELFDRSTSYDTSDDAIVRVTASDVRRGLLQHYGKNGSTSEYRISLPSGSYIPEITRIPRGEVVLRNGTATHQEAPAEHRDSVVPDQEPSPDRVDRKPEVPGVSLVPKTAHRTIINNRQWFLRCSLILRSSAPLLRNFPYPSS